MNEEQKKFIESMIGKKVIIVGNDHPHNGEIGEIIKYDVVMGKPAFEIKGEYNNFYVFSGKDIKAI